MNIGRLEILNCKDCPALKWRGENSAIPRRQDESDYYCAFTYVYVFPDAGIPEHCPLVGFKK